MSASSLGKLCSLSVQIFVATELYSEREIILVNNGSKDHLSFGWGGYIRQCEILARACRQCPASGDPLTLNVNIDTIFNPKRDCVSDDGRGLIKR